MNGSIEGVITTVVRTNSGSTNDDPEGKNTKKTDATITADRFLNPAGICIDLSAEFVEDGENDNKTKPLANLIISQNHGISRINFMNRTVEDVVGNIDSCGYQQNPPLFHDPRGVTCDPKTGLIYIAGAPLSSSLSTLCRIITSVLHLRSDRGNNQIRTYDRKRSGLVSNFAGNGVDKNIDKTPASEASFYQPTAVTFSTLHNSLFVGCLYALRRIDFNKTWAGAVSTIHIGIDQFRPYSIVVVGDHHFSSDAGSSASGDGTLIISCTNSHSIYAVNPLTGHCVFLAGSTRGETGAGFGNSAQFSFPSGIAVDEQTSDGNLSLYVADHYNHRIVRLTIPATAF